MTNFPSLLWRGAPAPVTLAKSTLADCGLAALLPARTLDWLARRATREEIADRQALFARLRESDADRFAALQCELDRVAAAHHAATGAATEIEALALRLSLLRVYAAVFPTVAEMAQAGLLGVSHATFWPTQTEAHAALVAALPALEETMAALARVTLNRSPHAPMALTDPLETGLDEAAPARRVDAFAASLGLTLPAAKPSPIRLDEGVSTGWLTLHRCEADRLRALLAPFADLPIGTLLICRDELEICTSICALLSRAAGAGCSVCTPQMCDCPTFDADGICDLALLPSGCAIVPNDVRIGGERRFFFLTGANGGGKTTYLRALVGGLLLARAGCPIAAERAAVYPWPDVATHFPLDEAFSASGRFVDEQNRADAMADRASADSFFAFNETFSGTDHDKGLSAVLRLARRLADTGASGLFVTHFHAVAASGLPLLSAVVDEQDGGRRTYRIVESGGTGSSFARDILRKYKLDAASLAARQAREEGGQ